MPSPAVYCADSHSDNVDANKLNLLFIRFIMLKVIWGLLLLGLTMPGIPSALASLGVGHTGMAAAAAAASRLGLSGLAAAGGHNVLLVSNLNPEVSTHAILE